MSVGIAQFKVATLGSPGLSTTATFTSPTTAGCAVLVIFRAETNDGTSSPAPTITDNNSGSYSSVIEYGFGTTTRDRIGAILAANLAGRSGHIVTITSSKSSYFSLKVYELSGVPTSSLVTGTAGTFGGVLSAVGGATVTPGVNGLHFAAVSYDGSATTITPTWSGATEDAEIDEGNGVSGALSILTDPAVASTARAPSWTLGTNREWGTIHFAIAESGAAVTAFPYHYYAMQQAA